MDPMPASGATLTWGVKQSFRNYVEGSGGTIEAGLGAERGDDGVFVFAGVPGKGLTRGADGKPQGKGVFSGEVRFQAHGGMLSVFMADPAIEIGEAGAFLTVADDPDRIRRVPLAKLDMAAAVKGVDGSWRVALSADQTRIDFVRVLKFKDFTQSVNIEELSAPILPSQMGGRRRRRRRNPRHPEPPLRSRRRRRNRPPRPRPSRPD